MMEVSSQGLPFEFYGQENRLRDEVLSHHREVTNWDFHFRSSPYLPVCGFFITAHPESPDGSITLREQQAHGTLGTQGMHAERVSLGGRGRLGAFVF